MCYQTNFNFIPVKILLLLFITVLFSCSKNKIEVATETKYEISAKWEIAVKDRLKPTDGAIYNNEYLVFSEQDGKRIIKSYNLLNKKLLWEYDFTSLSSWGSKMDIYKQYLVFSHEGRQISAFDLNKKELINTITSDAYIYTPSTYYNDKVYFSFQDHYDTKATIKSMNMEDGIINEVYEWPFNKELFNRLTSPIVVKDINNNINFIMLLQLFNREKEENFYSETFLINVNEEGSLNWIDTLAASGRKIFFNKLPVLNNNNVIVNYSEILASYNVNTGSKNWTTMVPYSPYIELISKNNHIYGEFGPDRNYAKINGETGEIIWDIRIFLRQPTFKDFELFENHMVVVSNNMGSLNMFNNTSGKYVAVENRTESGIANPKFYAKDTLFITHQYNKIIGFKLNAVN